MPRYYFEFSENNQQAVDDPEGTELPDEHAAHTEAAAALGERVKDVLRQDGVRHQFEIKVKDESGNDLFKCVVSYDTILLKTVH